MDDLAVDYIFSDNKVEFFKGLPTFFRYYVEGNYERTMDSDPDDDLAFSGFLTYFKSTDSYSVIPEDRNENMFFDQYWSAAEVIQLIENNHFNHYKTIHTVHKLSYTVDVRTESV